MHHYTSNLQVDRVISSWVASATVASIEVDSHTLWWGDWCLLYYQQHHAKELAGSVVGQHLYNSVLPGVVTRPALGPELS